jgi:SMODS domain-containing protein
MSADSYLRGIISKYTSNKSAAAAAVNAFYPVVQAWGGIYIAKAFYSGSYAKGTAISLSSDADIFISLYQSTPGTLAQNFESLFTTSQKGGYECRKQNVSIRVTANGFHIDLVPGRQQDEFGNDHSIYKRKTDSWVKTDVSKHVAIVTNSNRTEEIKLTKIWRERNNLDFPSFYLELAVIEALKWSQAPLISDRFLRVLDYFQDGFIGARFMDPSNTNNIVSDDLTQEEKKAIKNKSAISRSKKTWQEIVW